nr:uncharacterized protein LOC123760760 [Procambarus clarkii]
MYIQAFLQGYLRVNVHLYIKVSLQIAWQDHLVRASRDAAVFTYSELHSPANDSLFYRPSQPHERYVCEADVRQQRPAWGRATDGNFLRIINTDTFPQMIRMEVCRFSGERCSFVPEAVTSTCRQRYSIHKMAAVDPQAPANGAFLAAFRVPSGCFCHVSHDTGTNNQQASVNTSPATNPLAGATLDANSSSGANNLNDSFIAGQNFKSSETSRFTRNQNSGVDSFTSTHSAGQQNEQQSNQNQWWQQRQQQQLGDSSSSIHIGRQTSVVNTHHQPSLVSPAPTARQVLGSPSPMPPLATFHRHTSITISQPSSMNTGSPAPSAPAFGSPTPTVVFPISPLISTTPQTPTSTTTTFSPVISTTSFAPAISTTTFGTPMPTPHLVQTFTENSGGIIESQLISANTQNQNGNQHFSISSADVTSQHNTDKAPRDIVSEGLSEIDVLSVENDMQVSKTSDNNFILSLRQVKSDGTVVPLDLVINVDGRLVSAASKFAAGSTQTAERRHDDVDQISVDLQELPLTVKNYLSTLQTKVHVTKSPKIIDSHRQDEFKDYPDQLSLATLSDESINSFAANSHYTKNVPSIEIDAPKISSIHHITNSHYSESNVKEQGTTSVPRTPSNFHVTQNTFTQEQINLSPRDKYLEFTDLSENIVTNSIGASSKIKPNSEIKYLNRSQSFKAPHQTPLHQTHIHQPQTTFHTGNLQLSTPGFRSLASSLGQNHQTRQVSLSHSGIQESLNEESIFIGNKSTRGFSQAGRNPFLSTKLYPDRPHVIQNYFIQVPDGLTDDVGMADMMGSASQKVPTSVGLETDTTSAKDGTSAHSDGKILPEAIARLKNHRMTPISSHYSILPPPTSKSNSSSMLSSGSVLGSLVIGKRKRKSLSMSEPKKHISANSTRTTRDTIAVTRTRRTRDTVRPYDERSAEISRKRSLNKQLKPQNTEMVSVDFSRRAREAGFNPIRGSRAMGIDSIRSRATGLESTRGRVTGVDSIRGGRATGINFIRGSRATGIDSIRGKATGSDFTREGRATGNNANGKPQSLSSENKDVHVNIHLNFAPDPQSMSNSPDRLVISANSHSPQKLDPSQYYSLPFYQPSDSYDSVNYNREKTQYLNHLLVNRQVPNQHPWKSYPSTSKLTALVGNWPYSTLRNNHETRKTFPSDSTAQDTINLPEIEHSFVLNKYFAELPMKQTPHTSNQSPNTPLCASCQSDINSASAWSRPWSSHTLRPARHVALLDEANRSEVTPSSVPRHDVTVSFKGQRMSLGPHWGSLPRPRPARRTVIHFPGNAAYRPLVHEPVRVLTRKPRTLKEFIMSPSPHPGVIVPHQRDKSSWKL